MAEDSRGKASEKSIDKRHVFIIGAKCIGQYGGYETFLDKLTEVHADEASIQYYIVTKANGDGAMDETKLSSVSSVKKDDAGAVRSFRYHNANVVKLTVPQIGAAQAIAYDVKAFKWCLKYIEGHQISDAIIYVLACRIGPFFGSLVKKAHGLGARVYVNPDGHEWKRAKWSGPIRKYWKESEKLMVKAADLLICDSVNIEKYIKDEYSAYHPSTVYIAYGADITPSTLSDDDPKFVDWMNSHGLSVGNYYMCCGRFVPENSFEIMIREFMKSKSSRDFAIITTKNDALLEELESKLHWRSDKRIKFVGTVYDSELLKKIRECAYGNFHGHTVGGTNPSLLEALGSTDLNLLIDVGFNQEVGKDAAMYWSAEEGNLSRLIDEADAMDSKQRSEYGLKAKERIKNAYSWIFIGEEYRSLWQRNSEEVENLDYKAEYQRWLENVEETDLLGELKSMDDADIEDAFYRDLAFGTGGLRGTIGAGTNRMNVYVVAKASQGLSRYLLEKYISPSVVIGYDSRIKSDVFAKTAAGVFAANGISVHLWPELTPVPTVSFAVRELRASAGVMITASHNPSKYNGYKVYGDDGCQITTEAAKEILTEINDLDIFADVKNVDFDKAVEDNDIKYIDPMVLTHFIEAVKSQSVLYGDGINRDVAIVYSPLNGTGLKPVTRALKESGFTNITVVEEQKNPDGNFPTCPFPNPEIREAMDLGLQYCEKVNADLLLATDPDADRCGIAVKAADGSYQLVSGNEVGLLLLDFICSQRIKHNRMPEHPVFGKTIVTIDLAEKIADHYGVETFNTLTGFKFIGEQIGRLEAEGRETDYICGFEESYGYLTGSYVRDKDAVNAAFMICEMFAFYKTKGISLLDKLDELFNTYGYCLNTLHFYEFDGSAGMERMAEIMGEFHKGLDDIAGYKVLRVEDYSKGLNGLPKSDVLKYFTDFGSVVVRPSGTEPKLKTYLSITADNKDEAEELERKVDAALAARMK